MTAFDPKAFSKAMAELAAAAAPMTAALHTHRGAGASAFHWKDGLYVGAEETVDPDEELQVSAAGGEKAKAEILGRDPSTGIVLIRPVISDTPSTFGRAGDPWPCNLAVAAGRSAEGEPIAALGTVAECGEAWRSMRGGHIDRRISLAMIADSRLEGGPVIDAGGRLIGMLVFGPRGRPLVIPAATIDRIAPILAEKGHVSRGFLGAVLHPARRPGGDGVMVMHADPQGPAAAAGLFAGDIIIAWNGETVTGPRDLMRRLGPDSAGQNVTLGIVRGGEDQQVPVTIGAKPLA
ncbi:S1C family serine protease [Mesorhizobium xinjiangense]|uniref:S1C family serine protease n=1 Tax=Mesorhizobium xinjiangense TaxID=2678685 RepID=UPI0012ECCF57|nr:S1C family serine protease [Mesorhizobium xinjiangense]